MDDHALLRTALARMLQAEGWTVLEAADAESAMLALLRLAPIDLMLSDIRMPGRVDGIGLARWVHAQRPEIPVILMSGGVRPGYGRGVDEEFIPKPSTGDFIISRIRARLVQAGWSFDMPGASAGAGPRPDQGMA